MAETQVVENFEQPENIPPPVKNSKNPPGRPRKDGLPAGSNKEPDIDEDVYKFFAKLQPLSDDWWNTHTVYVYRQYPITDRRSAGKLLWIDKFSEPFDQERLMRLHGSGVYRIDLLEDGNKRIASTSIRIFNKDYPSVVPAGEWVDDPKNKDWEWCRPKETGKNGNGATGLSADDFLKLQAALGTKQDSSAAILAAITPLLDPQRQTDMLATFAALMKPKEEGGLSTILLPLLLKLLEKPTGTDPMIAMLIEDRKAMREQIDRLSEKLSSGAKSWIDEALANEALMKRMFGRGDGGSSEPTVMGLIDKGIEKLGGPVGDIAKALTFAVLAKNQAQGQAPKQPATVVNPSPLPAPTSAAPHPPPQPAQPAEQPAAQPAQPHDQIAVVQKYLPIIQQCIPFLIDKFKDESGYDFRDWFISGKRFGNVVWEGLRKDIGVDGFVQILRMVPAEQGGDQIRAALAPEEKFRQFMEEFFSEDDGDFEDDDFTKPPEGTETNV